MDLVDDKLDLLLKILIGDIRIKEIDSPPPFTISEKHFPKFIWIKDIESYLEIHSIYIRELIIILEENDFVGCSREGNFIYSCDLTYRGKMFIQNGGYKGIRIKNDYLNRRVRLLSLATLILSIATAVGSGVAACYYSLEIWKFVYSFFHQHG